MRILRAWKQPKSKGFASMPNKQTKPPVSACVAHRCATHENIKPINVNTSEATECGACIAEDIKNLMDIYTDTRERLERACGALDLLSPGAGNSFLPPKIDDDERTTDSE